MSSRSSTNHCSGVPLQGAGLPIDLDQLHAEIERRFGVVPNFFRLAPESPEVAANLWGFAKFAYLDNPLPSLFKERLFVYLSRFCEIRYCIARHVGFLAGLGRPSGDDQCPIQTVEEIIRLIRRPFPRAEGLEPYVSRCAACETPIAELPPPDSSMEEAVFACASHVFLQTPAAPRCLAALNRSLGELWLQHLLVFLAFIRTAHYWTKIHAELVLEEDIERLLAAHEKLADCLLNDPEARACEISRKLMEELVSLRDSKERHEDLARAFRDLRVVEEALRQSEAQLEAELADSKLLQSISMEMIQQEHVESLYEKIIDAAVTIMRSDYASMQMLYPERGDGGELRLLTFRGFNPQAAKFWEWVRADSDSTCGEALRRRERVIAEDVEQCGFMAGTKDLETYLETGIHAVQTTPLCSRGGKLLGMISTHWRSPHRPSERDLRLLDILARQAADLVERKQADDSVRRSHAELGRHAEELNRFNRAAVDRELRMIALKKEVNELCRQQGQVERYPLEFEQDGAGSNVV